MIQKRIIPCLLLKDGLLYKTVRFGDAKYVGDPINVVKIFNEKEVHELIFLDIDATPENREPNYTLIGQIASECFMPICYGGGIKNIDQMKRIFASGIEKISLNTSALHQPQLVRDAAEVFGSQSIIVAFDVKKSRLTGKYFVSMDRGRTSSKMDPVSYAIQAQTLGAGELLVNSIDRDGTMSGYDIELMKKITSAVKIPVIALGGAGSIEDLRAVIKEGGASAAAAGSLFVFYGVHRAVLVSYPSPFQISSINEA